ncbi:MAG TPA: hypothetical protein VFT61_07775 [Sphingomicrobium sp.]|nr:hypothetical protein [Sphingomicrobium sp.]
MPSGSERPSGADQPARERDRRDCGQRTGDEAPGLGGLGHAFEWLLGDASTSASVESSIRVSAGPASVMPIWAAVLVRIEAAGKPAAEAASLHIKDSHT